MTTVTFTELRNNARKYFDAVEQGETLEVYRHGKPIAILSPYPGARARWKRARPRPLKLEGATPSKIILAERR